MTNTYPPPPTTSTPTPCSDSNPTKTTSAAPAWEQTRYASTIIYSGQFILRIPLASLEAFGVAGWRFDIEHLRDDHVNGVLGPNINFTQNIHLEQENGAVVLATEDNLRERFVPLEGGGYSSEANNTAAVLMRSQGGADEFTIVSSKGNVTKFYGFENVATPGRIKSVTDRHEITHTFAWRREGGMDQLTEVRDGYGRAVQYRYYGSEGKHRLQEIEDFLGRKMNFQYDGDGRLVAVVTPSITRAAPGGAFPGGTAYVFQYDSANPRPERRNDLVRVWYPNQTAPYLNAGTRTVDVARVYAEAVPRYFVEYGQDPTDEDHYGRVIRETVGAPPNGPGGTWSFIYTVDDLPVAPFYDVGDPNTWIVMRTVVTDPNGNQAIYDFNPNGMAVRVERFRTRQKLAVPGHALPASYVTWKKYNSHNQPLLVIQPEGNSVECEYDSGQVPGIPGIYVKRIGLLVRETHRPGNPYSIHAPTRPGSSGQTELTRLYFYDPLFNLQCATIERRGNPVRYDGGNPVYFSPQNEGPTPADSDRRRYSTITYFDYQKNTLDTIKNDPALKALLFPGDASAADKIAALIEYVDEQMNGPGDAGPLPPGFEVDLGDVNGEGTGNGGASGLPAAKMLGNVVKIAHPPVRQLVENTGTGDPWKWLKLPSESPGPGEAAPKRIELFTRNDLGQVNTHTSPEGNLTVYVRYPDNDPQGTGQGIPGNPRTKQYGGVREVHADADPNDVMSLVGADGDLVDFRTDVYPRNSRNNTPGEYQDLVTRHEAPPGGEGAYDALGNALAETDARGFMTRYERDELGRAYRTTLPAPYSFRTETYYDANGNVVREDVEDKVVAFASDDPADPGYAKFTPSGSGATAHVPMKAGAGGAIRPGWFTNLHTYDLLDRNVEDDLDATGSSPSRLVTTHEYDPNGNLVRTVKPEGNTIEYDYDERDLQIATRVGHDPASGEAGAVTISVYDDNGNLIYRIGAADRLKDQGDHTTTLRALLNDAFRSCQTLDHTGDWLVENIYDGFDRVIKTIDAVGNIADYGYDHNTDVCYDPDGRVVRSFRSGPAGGASPKNRVGSGNVLLAEAVTRFDEAGRAYETEQAVFLNTGKTGGVPTHILPSGRSATHTGGGLAANGTANDHTATVTLTAGDESYVLTRNVYDRAGRLAMTAQDNTAKTRYAFDGVDRQISVTDAQDQEGAGVESNVAENTFDANGNLVHVLRRENATIADAPNNLAEEVFESRMSYDALNRLVLRADQGADGSLTEDPVAFCSSPDGTQTILARFGYDSRGNQTLVIDPKGNTAVTVYDGAGRSTETIQHLREDGDGAKPVEDEVCTRTSYDGNGRVVQLIDDRGGTTAYTFDTLDRQVTMAFHDGSTRTTEYNEASDVVRYTDENQSESAYTYDAIGRRIEVAITRAAGVVGTTAQAFQYDGLSRMTYASDTSDGAVTDGGFVYDSLGRLIEEKQSHDLDGSAKNRYATYHAFTSLPTAGFTYPDARQVAYGHDALYRRTNISDGGGLIAKWSFFGPTRVAEVELGNDLILTHLNNARTRSAVQKTVAPNPPWGDRSSDRLGYDGAGRMITKRYLDGGIDGTGENPTYAYNDPTAVVGFTAAYDDASNKKYERHLHSEKRSHLYPAVDSLNRLREYQRGKLATGGGSIESGQEITLPGTDRDRTYDLDGLGNWQRTVYTPVGGSETTEVRQHNHVNQITRFDGTDVLYDHGDNAGDPDPDVARRGNGNVAVDGTRRCVYDAINRLKEVYKKDAGGEYTVQVAAYTYDALGRRIRKVVSGGGVPGGLPDSTTDYLYADVQCVEERTGADQVLRQYVWGQYVDELVQQKDKGTPDTDYYLLSDLLYRSVALTDADKNVQEAYDTDAYGKTLIFADAVPHRTDWFTDADASHVTAAPICRFVFTGRELDPETQIYFYRARYYQQGLGRFVSRDVGFYDYLATASLYLYGTSNPTAGVDPTGFVWEIQRDWLKPQAIARGEHDTVENLAKKIGLNGREYRAWLEPADGKGLPASEKDDVGSCRLFKIPNEIIAFWGGELGGVGKALVGWQQQISTLQGRGFYTIPVQGWTSARLSQEIRDDSRRKWLHGFFFWGHGNCVSILLDSSKKNDNTGNWDYYFAQFFADTAYRLGFGVMFCCEGKSARFVFSDNAIFWGMSGTLVPLPPFFPPPVGNIIKPGEQGTRR